MGLGAEWKPRWCVIMPRYQFPTPGMPAQERVARTLLVCYKAPDQCLPICKVWLDGAVARSVVGSRGSGVLQCALVSPSDCARSQQTVLPWNTDPWQAMALSEATHRCVWPDC